MTTITVAAVGWIGGAIVLNSLPVKTGLAKAVQNAIKMPFALDSLGYSPVEGLNIKGARIHGSDPQAVPFLSTENVKVRARLLPLLQRKLIIDEITIANAALDCRQDESGRFNLPILNRAEKTQPAVTQPEAQTTKAKTEPILIEAKLLRLAGAHMIFRDQKGKALAELRGVSLVGKLAGQSSFGGKVEVAQVLGKEGKVILQDFTAPFSYTEEGLEVSGLGGNLASGRVAGKIHLATAEKGTPIKADVETENVDIALLLAAAGRDKIGLTGKLRGRFAFSGKLNETTSRQGEATLQIEGGTLNQNPILQATGLLLGIEELISLRLNASHANLEIRGEEIRIRALMLQSERVQIDVAGKVGAEQKLDLDARLSLASELTNKMPSELARNFLPITNRPGWSAVDFEIKGTLNKPKSNLETKLLGGSLEKAVFDWLGVGATKKTDESEPTKAGKQVGNQ